MVCQTLWNIAGTQTPRKRKGLPCWKTTDIYHICVPFLQCKPRVDVSLSFCPSVCDNWSSGNATPKPVLENGLQLGWCQAILQGIFAGLSQSQLDPTRLVQAGQQPKFWKWQREKSSLCQQPLLSRSCLLNLDLSKQCCILRVNLKFSCQNSDLFQSYLKFS